MSGVAQGSTLEFCSAFGGEHSWVTTMHAGWPRLITRRCGLCQYLDLSEIRRLVIEIGQKRSVLVEVVQERQRQDQKWGQQNHPDGTGPYCCWMYDDPETGVLLANKVREDTQKAFAAGRGSWLDVLLEEVAEAFAEDDPAKLRAELIQVAAVAVAWVEAIDRRTAG